MSGLATPEKPTPSLAGFPSDLGVDLRALADGGYEVTLEIAPRHLNYEGAVHGGVLSTLVDIAIGRAIRAAIDDSKVIMTIELQTRFLGAARAGTLKAVSSVVEITDRTAVGICDVRAGGRLVVQGSGTWFVRDRVPG